jgi:hypothetical protein
MAQGFAGFLVFVRFSTLVKIDTKYPKRYNYAPLKCDYSSEPGLIAAWCSQITSYILNPCLY